MNLRAKAKFKKPLIAGSLLLVASFLLTSCGQAQPVGEGGQGNLWDMFVQLMANAVEALFNVFHDWGIAIIIFTIIFRAILTPLMIRQTKSTYMMSKIQPRVQEIQQRFADDPRRVQEETQRLYAEVKYNPLAGCVPMLLQMPIFIALFQALRNIQNFVSYKGDFTFLNLVPDLLMTPGEAFAVGVMEFIPYLILMIVFAGATFLPMLLTPTPGQNRNQTLIMSAIMSVFMLWIGWSSPAGVLLYWGLSSLFGVLQSTLARRHFKHQDELREQEEIEVMPAVVAVERKKKKKRPTKKR